jgi:hypothetical protein
MSKRLESEQYYITFEMFVADVKRMLANARQGIFPLDAPLFFFQVIIFAKRLGFFLLRLESYLTVLLPEVSAEYIP